MIYVDPAQLLLGVWGMAVMMIVLASQQAGRERAERIADMRTELAGREEFRARHLSDMTCERLHRVEDVVSRGVIVARLCVDCDRQLDAPEWLTHSRDI